MRRQAEKLNNELEKVGFPGRYWLNDNDCGFIVSTPFSSSKSVRGKANINASSRVEVQTQRLHRDLMQRTREIGRISMIILIWNDSGTNELPPFLNAIKQSHMVDEADSEETLQLFGLDKLQFQQVIQSILQVIAHFTST